MKFSHNEIIFKIEETNEFCEGHLNYRQITELEAFDILKKFKGVKEEFGQFFEKADNFDEVYRFVKNTVFRRNLLIFESMAEFFDYILKKDRFTFLNKDDNLSFKNLVKEYKEV